MKLPVNLRTVTNLRCKTFDIFLHCGILSSGSVDCERCSVCGAVDLIDAFRSGTTHVAVNVALCTESRHAMQIIQWKLFFRGRGRGELKDVTLLLRFFVLMNIEISYMFVEKCSEIGPLANTR